MTTTTNRMLMCLLASTCLALTASADQFQLLTGVNPGLAPGVARTVLPSSFPSSGLPGTFLDGDRLAGTIGADPAPYLGTGTPIVNTNQYGALSFMFRRGSIPAGPAGQLPVMAIDYLGGPRLDLDGVAGGPRSRVPVAGQTAVEMAGTHSFIDLTIDTTAGAVALNDFDVTGTNQGFGGFGPGIAVTVNTIAGTLPNAFNQTGPVNPIVDTRTGNLLSLTPDVHRITNLGYELWQDSIDETSSTAGTLGTFQYLGSLDGWLIERDANGQFPTLAGLGLGYPFTGLRRPIS